MRFFATAAVAALAAQTVVGRTWFSKAAYNKWHENELERWLSDHDVPYPSPADRKDLIDLVNNNWEQSTEQATDSYTSVKDWIFDTWTESQLKAFLDKNGIPSPQPRTRDSLLTTARSNYQGAANKLSEAAGYPGDWLYSSWSESEIKSWLDERGVPAPQPSARDKLVAKVRRNSYIAAEKAKDTAASASSSAAGAQQSLTDALLDSWSDSDLKAWFDKNGIKVPQGSKRNELVALARKHGSKLTGDNVASSASSYYGAATSSAGNQFAQFTNDIYNQGAYWYNYALNQAGLAGDAAKSSLSSYSASASVSASSLSKQASKSAASASSEASKSGRDANKAASSAASKATASAKSAASAAKQEL